MCAEDIFIFRTPRQCHYTFISSQTRHYAIVKRRDVGPGRSSDDDDDDVVVGDDDDGGDGNGCDNSVCRQ